MDYVPPMAAITAAEPKLPHVDATAIAANSPDTVGAVPDALDPRSIYALSAQAADAMLTLVQTKTQAVATAEFEARSGREPQVMGVAMATAVAATPVVSPETTKTTNAATRNWNEDVRLDHSPFRKVGTDTVVQYDNPRVMAAWSAAFPDIADKKFRGLQISAANFKNALTKIAADGGFNGIEKNIYLLCNSDRFKNFTQDHPGVHINWIDVENDDILLFWPKESDQGGATTL